MDEVFITLETISQINRGDKLRVKGKSIDIDKRYGQFIWRYIDNEGRDSTKKYLIDTYSEIQRSARKSMEYIRQNKQNNKNSHFIDECIKLKNMANVLGKSFNGIKNLKNTYADCSSVVSSLNFIIDYIIKPVYFAICKELKFDEEYTPYKYSFDLKNNLDN